MQMMDAARRLLHESPETLAREAFGLAALCVAIVTALFLPVLF
jgi:hypothetical protein